MEKVICAKGHFYDGDKYKECPHCAEGKPPALPSAFSVERRQTQEEPGIGKTEEKRKLFGRIRDRRNKEHKGKTQSNAGMTGDRTQILDVNVAGGGRNVNHGGAKEAFMETMLPASSTETAQEDNVTQESGRAYLENVSGKTYPGKTESEQNCVHYENRDDSDKEYPDREMPEKDIERKTEKMEKITAGNLQRTGGQNEGKTIGYFSAGIDREPPVGYLICIAGEDYGVGFPLKSGNNYMGRSGSMDVVIMDAKVSREKQAYVMYEPHKREFFLKPGDSSGLCYLNDEVLLEPKKMQAYDEILLGDTKLILIPVCGERFSW